MEFINNFTAQELDNYIRQKGAKLLNCDISLIDYVFIDNTNIKFFTIEKEFIISFIEL